MEELVVLYKPFIERAEIISHLQVSYISTKTETLNYILGFEALSKNNAQRDPSLIYCSYSNFKTTWERHMKKRRKDYTIRPYKIFLHSETEGHSNDKVNI